MDPSSSSAPASSPAWPPASDLSLHLWTAVAALAIAVPVQAWRLNRRKSKPCPQAQHSPTPDPRPSQAKPSSLPVLNTIDEEDDGQGDTQPATPRHHSRSDASPDRNSPSKSKRSRDRRKRGPNPLKERSSRARQRVASWSLAAATEGDKSAHAVTTLEASPPLPSTATSTSPSKPQTSKDKRNKQKKRDHSLASSSRTGTESIYGDLDDAPSEAPSHEPEPEQAPIIRAPSTSTATSVSAGDSCLDNISNTSASVSIPTSSIDTSITCSSHAPGSSRTHPEADEEVTPPLAKPTHDGTSHQSGQKSFPNGPFTPSPSKSQQNHHLAAERRGSPALNHPRPYFSHNIDSRSSTSSPSRNYSPASGVEKEKEGTTVLYDSAASSSQAHSVGPYHTGGTEVALTTQISSLKGALSASRQREETLKAQCARLTAELQEVRWRLGLLTQPQAQNVMWAQQPMPPPLAMWGYPSTPGTSSAPHSHPMSPLVPNHGYPAAGGTGSFPIPPTSWGNMTPLRNLPPSKNLGVNTEREEEEEEDRLDRSPIAEAILKRPESFSRSRSRNGMSRLQPLQHLDAEEKENANNEEEQEMSHPDSSSTLKANQELGSSGFQTQSDVQEQQEAEAPEAEAEEGGSSKDDGISPDESDKREEKPFLEDVVFPSLLGNS